MKAARAPKRSPSRAHTLTRGLPVDGGDPLIDSTPLEDLDGYWRRRRASDPDLWVIEVDIAAAERFAAETILDD